MLIDGGFKPANSKPTKTLSLRELLARTVIENKQPEKCGWGPK